VGLAMAGAAKADFSACDSALREQDPHEKIHLYTICLTKGGLGRSDRAGALINRGVAHEMLGEHDQALADFDASIQLYPDGGCGHLNRGQLRVARKEWTLARDDFETAASLAFNSRIRAAAYSSEAMLLATCPDP